MQITQKRNKLNPGSIAPHDLRHGNGVMTRKGGGSPVSNQLNLKWLPKLQKENQLNELVS